MPPPDLYPRMIGGNERKRDADVVAAAEMILRIEQAEGEPEQRRAGCKRDIALVPGELDAKRFLALMPALRRPRRRRASTRRPSLRRGRSTRSTGISCPRASRGRYCVFCVSVPYFSISSPGPSEFGTMTMVTPSGLREEILPRTSDCACAEKPRPPCSLEMSMPRKP